VRLLLSAILFALAILISRHLFGDGDWSTQVIKNSSDQQLDRNSFAGDDMDESGIEMNIDGSGRLE
jgi:hypothetical protein